MAARQISDAMTRLGQVSAQRANVERRLGASFQAELQNNSALLDEIKRLSEEIDNLLKSAISLGNQATASVGEADTIVKNANSTAHQRKAEAEKALVDAQNALTTANRSRAVAYNAQQLATQFKVLRSPPPPPAQNHLLYRAIENVSFTLQKKCLISRIINMFS